MFLTEKNNFYMSTLKTLTMLHNIEKFETGAQNRKSLFSLRMILMFDTIP